MRRRMASPPSGGTVQAGPGELVRGRNQHHKRRTAMSANYVRVESRGERATIYAEGGIGFDYYGSGEWWLCDEPSPNIVRLAVAVRKLVYPEYPELDVDDILSSAGSNG